MFLGYIRLWFEVLTAVALKSSIFWSIMPCRALLQPAFSVVSCLFGYSTLDMEVIFSSLMPVRWFHWTTWYCVPEDITLYFFYHLYNPVWEPILLLFYLLLNDDTLIIKYNYFDVWMFILHVIYNVSSSHNIINHHNIYFCLCFSWRTVWFEWNCLSVH